MDPTVISETPACMLSSTGSGGQPSLLKGNALRILADHIHQIFIAAPPVIIPGPGPLIFTFAWNSCHSKGYLLTGYGQHPDCKSPAACFRTSMRRLSRRNHCQKEIQHQVQETEGLNLPRNLYLCFSQIEVDLQLDTLYIFASSC